ncbi:MAG: hypothetical protein KF901_32475, partial [Myxococcales bacterium]|nr:hypothetical protein [Myxococcales bacterium]
MVTRSSFGSGAPSWSLLLGLFACAVDPSGLAPIAQGDGGQGDATPGDATPVDVGPFDADTPDGPVPPDAGEDADIPDDVGVDARVPCEGELVRCGPLGVERCDEGLFELSEPCDLGCVPGTTPRCVRFVPSNVNRELLPEPGGAPVEVDGGSFDTTSCSGGMIVHQADGAPQLCVVSYDGDLTLRGEVRVRGTRPLVVLVAGTFEVAAGAVLDLRAEGTSGGPGGGGAEGGLFAGSRGSESGWYDDGGG